MRRTTAFLVLIGLVGLSACGDNPSSPTMRARLDVAGPSAQESGTQVSEQYPWPSMSDEALFDYVARHDSNVVVLLGAPGGGRGMVEGRWQMTKEFRDSAAANLHTTPGAELRRVFGRVPAVVMHVSDAQALHAIRENPFAHAVEPEFIETPHALQETEGCGPGTFSGQTWTIGGDIVPRNFDQRYDQIVDAWNRSNGAGINIGLVGTGVDYEAQDLNSGFAQGQSAGRTTQRGWIIHTTLSPPAPGWADDCAHGTHEAGTIAAAKNGVGAVGVAWGANLNVVKADVGPGPFGYDAVDIYDGINMAAGSMDSNIISLAFGGGGTDSLIADVLGVWTNDNRLFLGAAGTYSGILCDYPDKDVVFPASDPHVMAVSGLGPNGNQAECLANGPQVEAWVWVGTPQVPDGNTTVGAISLGDEPIVLNTGSSNAVAVATGIAALVWSQNKNLSAAQVRQILDNSEDGGLNAEMALGGMHNTSLSGCLTRSGSCNFIYKISQPTSESFSLSPIGGDGPYAYQWSTGGTSSQTSMLLDPLCGDSTMYSLIGTVTDRSDGTSMTKEASIEVIDSNPDCACPTCAQ